MEKINYMNSEDRKKVVHGAKIRRLVDGPTIKAGEVYTVAFYDYAHGFVKLVGNERLTWDIANFELVKDSNLAPLDLIV